MESVKMGDIVAIDIVDGTFLIHLQQLAVDGVNELAVMAHITVLAGRKRQVFCREVRQVQAMDMVLCLVAEADDGIVLACRQILQGLGEVAHHMELGTGLSQRVGNGATGHIGYLLVLDLTHVELVSIFMVIAIDDLIV